MEKVTNPFIIRGSIPEAYFCGREKETEHLVRYLTNGNNVVLHAPRRIGKSKLIEHCFQQPAIKGKYYTIFVDILQTGNLQEFTYEFGKAVFEATASLGNKMMKQFAQIVQSLHTDYTVDPFTGLPKISMSIGHIENAIYTIEEVFRFLEQADKPCIVAIDEFQQINQYGDSLIEATLRTHVQYCTNTHFIFSGSQRHLMGKMFTSPARPFYQSVAIYNLPLLPKDKYIEFCVRLFESHGKHVSPEVPHALYERFEGVTYYMQRVMNELFARTSSDGTCSVEQIEEATRYIILTSANTYEDLMYQLPEKQSLVLRAIARDGKAKNLTSGAFIKRHALQSASSVKSAVPALLDKGLITSDKGIYQVYDKFLEMWLQFNM